MHEDDLRAIFAADSWYRALTFRERRQILERQAPAGQEPEESEDTDLPERWRAQPAFRGERFRQRLREEGLDEAAFDRILRTPPGTLQRAHPEPPTWLRDLEDAFRTEDDLSLADLQPSRGEESSPFLVAIRPLLVAGYRRLERHLAALPADLPLDRQRVARTLFSHVAGRLSMFLRRSLVLELQIAVMEESLEGETPEERFRDFLRRLEDRAAALEILARYPVLARQVSECVRQGVDFACEFLDAYARDQAGLRQTFGREGHGEGWGADGWGDLTEARPGAGDSHRDGRSVILLTFASGRKLVYKPRSLGGEARFDDFLSWAEEHGFEPAFRHLAMLDRETHGWVEFVEAAPLADAAEAERFYRRQGGFLALLHLLGANDIHFENLIAAGEHPVIIDLETLFHPTVDVCEERLPFLMAGNELYRSVQQVGLLPHRIWGAEGQEEGVDLSGLTAGGEQMTAQPMLGVEGAGTDRMRFHRRPAEIPDKDHAPRLGGARLSATDFTAAIAGGFRDLYRILRRHREELLGESGPLAAFRGPEGGVECRAIFRPTLYYTDVLGESFHPDVLQDALERDLLFDTLWLEQEGRPRLAPLIEGEQRDLVRTDIPLFTSRPDSRDLWTGGDRRLVDFFPASGLDRARATLAGFGDDDLARQLWLIETSLDAVPRPGVAPRRETYPFREGQAEARPEELLAAARAAAERLATLAFRGRHGDASWSIVGPLGSSSEGAGHWSYGPAEPGLYQGLAGIALFLAYAGDLTGEERYGDLARQAWRTLRYQLDSGWVALPGVGAFTGWGGILYTAVHLGSLWQDEELFAEADAIVRELPAKIAEDTWYDLIGGAAGCLLALLAYHRVRPAAATLEAARLCGERLLATAQPQGTGCGWVITAAGPDPLGGLSHGAAGMALALAKLTAATGDERFRDLAREALAYERTLFDPAEQNWVDLRQGERPEGTLRAGGHDFVVGWCHGAPGIGLARLAGLGELDEPVLRDEIAVALATTLAQGFGSNHSLCHGDLGNGDLLLVAAEVLNDPALRARAYRLAAGSLAGIEEHGWLYGYPAKVEPLGLMVGLAGIGYQLLRLAAPERVPSVLVLAPPPPRSSGN